MKAKSKQPLETVTVKGSSVTIYFTPNRKGGKEYPAHTLIYTAAGKRERKFVTDLEVARKLAKTIAGQLSEGTGHVHTLTPQEVADYSAAIRILRATSSVTLASACQQFVGAVTALGNRGTISDAVSTYLRVATQNTRPTIKVADLVKEFITAKENEGLSDAYLTDVSRRLKAFAGAFHVDVRSVKTADISVWLRSIKATGRNFNNYRNAVCTLFSYARERDYLPRQEKTEAELLGRSKEATSEIGIYSPQKIQTILDAAPKSLSSTIAIGAFAGLRMMEIFRLKWQQIHIGKEHIEVLAKNAKTAQRRLVPISSNLAAWLEMQEHREGRVTPNYQNLTNLSRAVSQACEKAGVEMVPNGLRHSFASYRLALVKSADQVALEMGNSPRKLFQNYRELVSLEEAQGWFAVAPG
jgi:integrase